MSSEPVLVHRVNFDFDRLREVSELSVRRAAAFLGWGYHATKGDPIVSLTLPGLWRIEMLPDPMPLDLALEAQNNFRDWVIGGCLAELDQGYHRFQAGVWETIEYSKRSGTRVPAGWAPRRLRPTNSASREEALLAAMEVADPMSEALTGQLRSLAVARNCLMHASGHVTPERAGGDDHLNIQWSYLQTYLETPEGIVGIGRDQPQPRTYPEGVKVFARTETRMRRIAVGELILLDPHDQIEICMFYQLLAARMLQLLGIFCASLGIERNVAAAPPGAMSYELIEVNPPEPPADPPPPSAHPGPIK